MKIYLDASPEERARRRASDPAHTGGPAAVAEVKMALTERDELDRTRPASPLHAAADAVVIDTTGKSVEEVVREVMGVIQGRNWELGIRNCELRIPELPIASPQPPAPSPYFFLSW